LQETTDNKNISFFDSGQGGLTIWEDVCQHFPNLNSTYLGDNARAPYGNKSKETIIKYSSEAVYLLARRKASMVVVACGSASSVAVKALEEVFKIPIIGIVDSLAEVASLYCKSSQRIAILGTRFTVQAATLSKSLESFGFQNIWQKPCPLFVPIVEEGLSEGEVVRSIVASYLADIPNDTQAVLMACTRFPRLKKAIAEFLFQKWGRPVVTNTVDGIRSLVPGEGEPIHLLEASPHIIAKIEAFLASSKCTQELMRSKRKVLCTDDPKAFERVAKVFCRQETGVIEGISRFL